MSRLQLLFCIVVLTGARGESEPKLQIQPSASVIMKQVGGTLALTCKPNVDDPSLITQLEWRDPKNRRIDNKDRSSSIYVQNIGGEFGMMVIFQKLAENHAGNYTCTAMYSNTERLTATISVNTYIDITFVDAPESQFPRIGQDYLVKCKVQGNPAPIVEWYKNDQVIISNDRYVTQNEGLLIKNVRESDDGVYKCTALVLGTGEIRTRNIKVEVVIPPKISPLTPVSVIEGETASTKCFATGKPPPTYRWIKERTSQDLAKTDRFDVKQNTGDLIITRVEFNDDDMYKCVAENRAGRDELRVKINVLVKPKIFEFLNVTAPVGSETKIICKARGRPTPKIMFRKLSRKEPFKIGQQMDTDRIIVEQEQFESKGETFGTLIITKLNRSDDGLYECIAENSANTAYKNGHITVEFPPTFERTKMLPQAFAWGERPGNLTCIPEAIPNATITWKFNGIEINEFSTNFKIMGTGPVSSLIVMPRHDRRFYTQYECVARNKLGTKSHFLWLKEAVVPQVVTQVKIQSLTATTIRFAIEPPQYFDGMPIRSITVQYREERQQQSWDYALNRTWSFQAPYVLENLIPERTYHFRFAARNDVGMGPWLNFQSITMPRRSEPGEPQILRNTHRIDDNSSNRAEVILASPYADHYELKWNVPPDNGDPIDYYEIRYCAIEKINGAYKDIDCSEEIKQSVQYTSYQLSNLRGSTLYKIEVRAHNAIGLSAPGQIKVKTAQGRDTPLPHSEPVVTNMGIIGIVIGAIFCVLLLVDICCCCVNRQGIIAMVWYRNKAKQQEDDPKLGRDEREPLKPENNHINGERTMSVEFDGKHVYSKSGEIIGKHSAV